MGDCIFWEADPEQQRLPSELGSMVEAASRGGASPTTGTTAPWPIVRGFWLDPSRCLVYILVRFEWPTGVGVERWASCPIRSGVARPRTTQESGRCSAPRTDRPTRGPSPQTAPHPSGPLDRVEMQTGSGRVAPHPTNLSVSFAFNPSSPVVLPTSGPDREPSVWVGAGQTRRPSHQAGSCWRFSSALVVMS